MKVPNSYNSSQRYPPNNNFCELFYFICDNCKQHSFIGKISIIHFIVVKWPFYESGTLHNKKLTVTTMMCYFSVQTEVNDVKRVDKRKCLTQNILYITDDMNIHSKNLLFTHCRINIFFFSHTNFVTQFFSCKNSHCAFVICIQFFTATTQKLP